MTIYDRAGEKILMTLSPYLQACEQNSTDECSDIKVWYENIKHFLHLKRDEDLKPVDEDLKPVHEDSKPNEEEVVNKPPIHKIGEESKV